MFAVAMHIWITRFSKGIVDQSILPIVWLEELMGPGVIESINEIYGPLCDATTCAESLRAQSTPKTSSGSSKWAWSSTFNGANRSDTGTSSGSAPCLHEDGGKAAIFERVESSDVSDVGTVPVEVKQGVFLGSTFRVVWCNCARDYTLKDIAEWCDWCRCRKCGGKHLPASAYGSYNGDASYRNRYTNHNRMYSGSGVDFSVDLMLLAVLIGAVMAAAWYLERSPYWFMNLAGVVATAHCLCLWLLPRR